MNDDPAEVDVIYAKITENSQPLQQVADQLVNKFVAAGLMARYVGTKFITVRSGHLWTK